MPLSPEGERQEPAPKQRRAGRGPRPTPKGSDRASAVCWRGRVRRTGTDSRPARSARGRSKTEDIRHARATQTEASPGGEPRGTRTAIAEGRPHPVLHPMNSGGPTLPLHEPPPPSTARERAQRHVSGTAGRHQALSSTRSEVACAQAAAAHSRATRPSLLRRAHPTRSSKAAAPWRARRRAPSGVRSRVRKRRWPTAARRALFPDERLTRPCSSRTASKVEPDRQALSSIRSEGRVGASGGGTPVPLAAPFTTGDASSRP